MKRDIGVGSDDYGVIALIHHGKHGKREKAADMNDIWNKIRRQQLKDKET